MNVRVELKRPQTDSLHLSPGPDQPFDATKGGLLPTIPPGPKTNNEKYADAAKIAGMLSLLLKRTMIDNEGCWLWGGALSTRGYAILTVNKKTLYAHRLTYTIACGPIEPGMVIDHLCRVPSCINPLHLDSVTTAENTNRGATNSRKTACPQGHLYSAENTRSHSDLKGRTRRYCITCVNERNVRWREEHKSKKIA